MATTTNYGWDTPDDTDLVKDGAAAIRTLGSSVDTTTKALNPSTTLGDLEYRSSTANTNTRLAIGSTGNILTVAGGVPTWSAPAASGSSYTLVNAGGTALTGAQTITVSGITSADTIQIVIVGASSASALSFFYLYFNNDTAANYQYGGMNLIGTDAYSASNITTIDSDPNTKIRFARQSNDADQVVNGYCIINGANSTNTKMFNYVGAGHNVAGGSGASGRIYSAGGSYAGASTISSVTFESATGNFDAGTIYVYKTA
jgi:hypothetical protein